jgi:transposase
MLTVDNYAKIRLAHRDGMSVREIARMFRHSRRKVREVLTNPQPTPYARTKPAPSPVLGAFHAIIDGILSADEDAPPKQRHTAMQLYRRLRDEYGYRGKYDPVRRYVNKHRRDRRETFIPLAHDPGQRLECDFGHIYVDFPDGRRQVPVFVSAWAYSNYSFALALPTERTEAVLAGMVAAFEFFAHVPREVWWDNPKTVAAQIFKGRERRPNEYYAALASHYAFEPLFCMPARGNEKPRAETRVRVVQRQYATPVPKVADLAELNSHFRERSLAEADRTVAGYQESIGIRFSRDRAAAIPVPVHRFDPCVIEPAQVDKYQTVQFDRNRYSVPRACAFRAVTVKGYIDRVVAVDGGREIACHERCYGRDEQVLNPLHYLATLGRRPATLDHAPVFHNWQLPEAFARLRLVMEKHHGPRTGSRHYIRVLQLLGEHPIDRVRQAADTCSGRGPVNAELIAAEAARLARADIADRDPEPERAGIDPVLTPLCQFQVPRPDLSRFNQLLSEGDQSDDRSHPPADTDQPQTTPPTDDGCRVREVGP